MVFTTVSTKYLNSGKLQLPSYLPLRKQIPDVKGFFMRCPAYFTDIKVSCKGIPN
jgi:hypothetical protein